MPWERGILLRRLLALKKWLAPPHVSYIIGFCTTWPSPRHPHHLRKSFQVDARADLAAPPVCPLFQNTIFQLDFSQFAVIFAARSCFIFFTQFSNWISPNLQSHFWPGVFTPNILQFFLDYHLDRGNRILLIYNVPQVERLDLLHPPRSPIPQIVFCHKFCSTVPSLVVFWLSFCPLKSGGLFMSPPVLDGHVHRIDRHLPLVRLVRHHRCV